MSEPTLVDQVYPRLPVFLQNAACWYYGFCEAKVRFGPAFESRLCQLVDSEKWSSSEIEAYQNERLRDLIRHAYESVPYYRERWTRLRLKPSDIKSREDLAKLPVLTKEDVRQSFRQLLCDRALKRELLFRHTSGTTGKALHFCTTKSAVAFQWAVWWRHRARFGVHPGALHANFTGKRVVPLDQRKPPYWRWNRPLHQALLTMHHLTAAKVPSIVEFLNSHFFEFYSGYPSIIHMLAVHAESAGLTLHRPPRAVFTGAENMLEFQRRDIGRFTGAILSDQYGCSEGCGNASHCPEFVYHDDFEFGIVEGLDLQPGNPSKSILLTGFASEAFPFIRYEVGDTGTPLSNGPCRCGRQSQAWLRIDGRKDDYVITPEGLRIMRFDYIFKETLSVKEAQVVQDRPGEITVRIVRRSSYSSHHENQISEGIRQWISAKMQVNFEYVDEIEREANGKFRAVLSRLKVNSPQA